MNLTQNRTTLEAHTTGRFCILRYDHLRFLNGNEVVVLAHLINHYCMLFDGGRHTDGWIEFATPRIQKWVPWSRRRIEGALEGLERKGILHLRRSGKSGKRFLILFGEEIERRCTETRISVEMHGNAHLNRPGCTKMHISGNQKAGKEQSLRTIRCGRVVSKEVVATKEHCGGCASTVWNLFGKRLKEAVQSVWKGWTPKPTIAYQWGAAIRLIHTVDGFSVEDIERILTWYATTLKREGDINSNGNPNHTPVAYGGASFRKKYQQLVGCMGRRGQGSKPKRPGVRIVDDTDSGDSVDTFDD